MKFVLLLAACALLAGCVSENTALINPEGQVVHCKAWGFGWLGAPVAMIQHHDCVKKAEANGYSDGGAPTPKPASSSTKAASQGSTTNR